MSTYVCGNCGTGKDLAKDGGMTVGVNTYCFQPECMEASMKPIGDVIKATADWCVSDGTFSMSGTRMVESSRVLEGVRWCFHCRARCRFVRVVMVPDGISYYEPTVDIRCLACNTVDADLFPGRVREWEEA